MRRHGWVRPLAAGGFGLVLAAFAAGCGGGGAGSGVSSGAAPAVHSGGVAAAGPAQKSGGSSATGTSTVPQSLAAGDGSKMIQTAQLALEVKSGRFDSTYSNVVALAGEEGGFVSASNASTDGDRIRSGSVTLSVPSNRYQHAIDRLRGFDAKLQALNQSSQDVSQQYVDLQARLANAEAERDAMLALMQKAQTVQDILAVQSQLGQYTQQVEQLKGQIDYLDHATSYSTIQVSIREAGVAAPPPPHDEWGIATAFWTGLHAFVQTVDGLIVVLTVAGPYLLLAGLGWIAWRRRPRAVTGPEV